MQLHTLGDGTGPGTRGVTGTGPRGGTGTGGGARVLRVASVRRANPLTQHGDVTTSACQHSEDTYEPVGKDSDTYEAVNNGTHPCRVVLLFPFVPLSYEPVDNGTYPCLA